MLLIISLAIFLIMTTTINKLTKPKQLESKMFSKGEDDVLGVFVHFQKDDLIVYSLRSQLQHANNEADNNFWWADKATPYPGRGPFNTLHEAHRNYMNRIIGVAAHNSLSIAPKPNTVIHVDFKAKHCYSCRF